MMVAGKFSEISGLLQELDTGELKEIAKRASALAGFTASVAGQSKKPKSAPATNGTGTGEVSFDRMMAQAIETALKSRGFSNPAAPLTPTRFRQLADAAAYRLKAQSIEQFLDRQAGSRPVRFGILVTGLSLLIDDMNRWREPPVISAPTLVQHLHRLPAVLDRAFPGYGEAGLLNLIVR